MENTNNTISQKIHFWKNLAIIQFTKFCVPVAYLKT